MKVLLVNGSPHKEGCTYTALCEVGDALNGCGVDARREQIATILWRYAGSPSADAGQAFADESEIASYAVAAVDWARANGVVNGADGNRFLPRNSASRAEVAVMLCNYLTQK